MATISKLSVDLVANTAKFRKDLERASKSADKSFSKMTKGAKAATAAFVAIGAAGLKATMGIAKVTADFNEALQDVAAKTGATSTQIDKLSLSMRKAAKATKFTATQTAEAGTFLAQAGLNVREITDALRPTLDLAAATKTSVQNTADFMTNIMKGMGMASTDLTRAADVLATTTAKSNTNLTDLAVAMSYAAPSARAMGMEIEETSALLGAMANAGIKGSMAGTALRRTFSALAKGSSNLDKSLLDTDVSLTLQQKTLKKLGVEARGADGKVRKLTSILMDLKAAGGDEEDMLKIFGDRAGSALMQFMNEGLEGSEKLRKSLEASERAATSMSAVQMNTLNGDLQKLNSQFKDLMIELGKGGLNKMFRNMIQGTTRFLKSLEGVTRTLAKHMDSVVVGLSTMVAVPIVAFAAKAVIGLKAIGLAMLRIPIVGITVLLVGLAVAFHKNFDKISFYAQRFTANMGIRFGNMTGHISTSFTNMGIGVMVAVKKMQLAFTKFKVKILEIFNDLLSKLNPSVNKLIEMYNAIPFLDDAKPVTLSLDTLKIASDIKSLEDDIKSLEAAKEQFTSKALFTDSFLSKSDHLAMGLQAINEQFRSGAITAEQFTAGANILTNALNGEGNESVDFDASLQATAEADQQALIDANKEEQQKSHLERMLGMKNDFYNSTLGLAEGSFADLLSAGAKGNKTLFALDKAMSIKSIIMATQVALAKANKLGFPANIPAMAQAAISGAVQLQTVRGQFHQGIDSVPDSGNYTLLKGERVMDQRLNRDMTDFLANQNQGGNTTTNNPTLNFNVSGGENAEAVEQMLMTHRGKFESLMRDLYNESAMNSPF